MEIWRPIPKYDGHYEASNYGRIRSVDRYIRYKPGYEMKFDGKIMKTRQGIHGYMVINLSKDRVKTTEYVHRMVASAFLDNKDNLPEINHINKNRRDNNINNLEWVTSQKNIEHSVAKRYKFINKNGDLVSIFNLYRYCRENNLAYHGMYSLHKGKINEYNGWTKY